MLTQAAKASAWDKGEVEMTPSERAYTLNPAEQRVKAIQDDCVEEWRIKTLTPNIDKEAKAKDELHVGLDIPKQAAIEVYNWVQEQDWPEGTELEPLEDYHITMLFVQGDGAGNYHDADWIKHDSHAVTVKGLKEFPPSKERDGLHPIVMLVDSDTIHEHHNALAEAAEKAGIDPGPYAKDKYAPHMTIGYGPSLPKDLKPPKLTFEIAESSVSTPREEENSTEKKSWHIGQARAPYEAELLKLADSWNPKDQWPNALRERGSEPTDVDCTCKDGHKLDCPVHGMHPTLPTHDDTLEFPDPSSPVGYDYHTDAPRTWMRAETKVAFKRHKLWLDDTRHPPDESWDWAKDASEAKKLTKDNDYDHMSLDHDLGIVRYEGKVVINPDALSGGDFALWLHEHRKHMPKSVNIHSHNGKGTDLMKEILEKHTDVTTDRAADDLEEDWAREFKVHEPSEIEKEVVDLPEKVAGLTQPQRERALALVGPDTSKVVHEFPDGWRIHKLITPTDRQREGQLMRNCWAKPLRWEPDAPGEGSNEPYKSLDEFMIDQLGGPAPKHQFMSLRDPAGYPHASFFVSGYPGEQRVDNALGHGNSQVSPDAAQRLQTYADQNGYAVAPYLLQSKPFRPTSRVASHQLAWLPGSNLSGKGLVTPSGDVHTWPVDKHGIPHHAEYVDQRQPYQLGEGSAHFFQIRPRGGLDTKGYNIPANVINHVLQTVPSLRAGEHTDWHFGADQFDTREYPDALMMPPTTMQEPAQGNPHPEKQGCTCDQEHKLDCPVHGLDPTEDDFDHSWSIPQGHPVGYPQDQPRNYMKAEGSVIGDSRQQHDAKTNGQPDGPRAQEKSNDGRKSNDEKSVGIDHVYSIACDCPACEHTREHAWHVQGQGTSEEGWSGLPRAEGSAEDEDEHGDNLEGEDVAIPKPPIEIRKKRKEQEDEELVRESPLLHSGAWQILPPMASRQSRLDT